MNQSREQEARLYIQSVRPEAKKNGLGPSVVEYYLRTHIPKKYRARPKRAWTHCRDFKLLKGEAEYYRPPFVPDLSEFYGDDREIIAYEIEDKCRVDEIKKRAINFWIGVTMDGWDSWDLMLIITNRFGHGWDRLIDTKMDLRQFWLKSLREDQESFLRCYPDLNTEEKIIEATVWRHCPFQSLEKKSSP